MAQNDEKAMQRGERLIAAIAVTYSLGEGISSALGASIGIAMAPEHGSNALDLLTAADAALFKALADNVRQTQNRRLVRLPHHINDPAFSAALVDAFRDVMGLRRAA